ncbi:MAG: DUF255 domain-containing protein [Bacteroidales bacterium]|nr:DUF255 domain-containing protein [Bacteroidales bacterium]
MLLSVVAISAQETKVKWYTLEEAVKLNEKTPKKFMIDLYTDWCGWCKKMDAETFASAELARYINANYYPVKFDAESAEDVNFAGKVFTGSPNSKAVGGRRPSHQLTVALFQNVRSEERGYPAIAYLTEKLELIGTVPGYKTAQQIEPLLHYIAEGKYQSVKLDDYTKTFVSQLAKQ